MRIEEITEAMQAIVDAAEAETRSLSDEEVTRYEGLEADLKAAQKSNEIRSRQDAYMSTAPAVITATPKGDAALEFAFEQYLRTGQRNSDLTELRAGQNTGTPAEGGYLVPDGFRQKLTEVQVAFGGVANEAEVITTSTGAPLEWPTNDDTANTGEIVAEAGTIASGDDLVFGTKTLGAYKYMSGGASNTPLRVSWELLQDSAFDVSAFVSRKLGERIARAQAIDFVQGDGSGNPKGINQIIPSVNLATSNPFTYAKLNALVHAVDPSYRAGAKFLMNDTTAMAIEALVDSAGRPILLSSAQSGIAVPNAIGTLLGYPVVIDQAMPDVANASATPPGLANDGFVLFGDIREAFVIRRVKDVTLVVDPYGRAANGQVQFIAWARADSNIQNAAAIATLGGYHA